MFFFLLELLALIFAFGKRFFLHIGNALDLVVVMVCLFWEIDGRSRGSAFLLRGGHGWLAYRRLP